MKPWKKIWKIYKSGNVREYNKPHNNQVIKWVIKMKLQSTSLKLSQGIVKDGKIIIF
jgi:hypothetical protein